MTSLDIIRDELVITDGVALKNRRIIIPVQLQPKALEQVHSNEKGTDNPRLMTEIPYTG